MLAQTGQREVQLISCELGDGRPGDDGGLVAVIAKVDDDLTVADHGEA